MRCKHCGWPNKPGETNCVKCQAPLCAEDDASVTSASYNNDDSDGVRSCSPLKKTVREDVVFGNGIGSSARDSQVEMLDDVCPKCGYLIREGVTKCPNCGTLLSAEGAMARSEQDAPLRRRPTRRNSTAGSDGSMKKTVNPYVTNVDLPPMFVLKPLKRANEHHELDELEYEGEMTVLNRGNTEGNNMSITSREQAVITRSGGRWLIEDRSEQRTTFVQVSRPQELHDGDIILLGNRLFEFHE